MSFFIPVCVACLSFCAHFLVCLSIIIQDIYIYTFPYIFLSKYLYTCYLTMHTYFFSVQDNYIFTFPYIIFLSKYLNISGFVFLSVSSYKSVSFSLSTYYLSMHASFFSLILYLCIALTTASSVEAFQCLASSLFSWPKIISMTTRVASKKRTQKLKDCRLNMTF